jgi:predicted metal-dependent hydrolase
LLKVEAYQEKIQPKKYENGELFPFLGQEYPLLFVDDTKEVRWTNDRILTPIASNILASELLSKWYIDMAADAIDDCIDIRAEELGLYPAKVLISKMRTTWGTCTSKGRISIAWRLIMAPPEVMDYVVVHELAHLKFLNHSKDFWALVQKYCPDFKMHKKWLKQHGASISFDF